MRRTIQRALVIVLAGAVLGLAANAVPPRRIPYLTPRKAASRAEDTVALQQAQELWASGSAFFLDAREPADYAAGHIAGALSLPIEEFNDRFAPVERMLTPDATIIIYCDGLDCDLSERLMVRLRELGYHNVRHLVNGWSAWRRAELATHTGELP
jgi:rhodanese-related sulfurtransferase